VDNPSFLYPDKNLINIFSYIYFTNFYFFDIYNVIDKVNFDNGKITDITLMKRLEMAGGTKEEFDIITRYLVLVVR